MRLFKRTKFLYPACILIFTILFSQSVTGQITSDRGPIFDYFRNAGYRIEFGFANVTAEGTLGPGVRYKKGNSIVYLFNDGINGIAFEGDLSDPDIRNFIDRYERGINATPEIIGLSRTAYAIQNKVLGVSTPDDVKFLNIAGDPVPDEGFFDSGVENVFSATITVPVIADVFKGIGRPGSELNLDAKGKPVNPSVFIAGPAATLGFTNFNWNNRLSLPDLSELSDGVTNLRFLYEDLPIIGESGDIIEAVINAFDNTSEAGGINFASDLEALYNEFANQQGYGAEQRTLTIDISQFRNANSALDVSPGIVQVNQVDRFRELTGILSPKGTTSKPQKKVKSTKVPGNPKGKSTDLLNRDVKDFRYGWKRFERDGKGNFNIDGKSGSDEEKAQVEGWDRQSRQNHREWLSIDYDKLNAQVNALNARLFNGEDLPLGLGVSSDPNIKYAPLAVDFLVNYGEVNNLDIESVFNQNTNIVFARNRARSNGNGGSQGNGDDPIDRGDGSGGFGEGDGANDNGGGNGDSGNRACLCAGNVCSCDDSIAQGISFDNSIAQGNSFDNLSVPSVLIAKDFLENPNFLDLLVENFGLEDKSLMPKLFMQALTIRNEKQGLSLNENQVDAEQAELFHITYNAAIAAKKQLLNHLNSNIETLNTTDVWMELLKKRDEKLYTSILNKLTNFYQKETGITDGSVFIAPKFKFELSITPIVPVVSYKGEAALALNDIKYDIDIVLTSARLSLGVDTDEDFKTDLGVVLNETELQFILDTWAQDTNGDNFIDQGYIIWLQQQLVTAKQHLSTGIESGSTEAYKMYNQLVLPMAVADFYKRQLIEDPTLGEASSSKWVNFIDTNTLKTSNLLARENNSYNDHNSISSEYFFSTQTAKDVRLAFTPSLATIQWNSIKLLEKPNEVNENKASPFSTEKATASSTEKATASSTETITALAVSPTISFSNVGFALKPNTLMLGIGSDGILTLTNTTNEVLSAATYVLTTSTAEDALYFDVAKFDVPEIPVAGTVTLFFDYTAVAADKESNNKEVFRLHKVGDFDRILLHKDFLIEENIMEAIDLNSFCEESQLSSSRINDDVILAGNRVITQNIIDKSGKLTVKAIDAIELTTGFQAVPGSTADFSITDCNGVQAAMVKAITDTMQ